MYVLGICNINNLLSIITDKVKVMKIRELVGERSVLSIMLYRYVKVLCYYSYITPFRNHIS